MISATWKPLDSSNFRPDLLARIAGTEVTLPGLGERADDLAEIVVSVATGIMDLVRSRVERAGRIEPDRVDKAYWLEWSQKLRGLDDRDVEALAIVDWARYGHMRGLTSAIREILVFREDVTKVLERLPLIGEPVGIDVASADNLFDRLLRRPADGGGIASHLRALNLEDQLGLRKLLDDPGRRRRLALSLGIPEAKIRSQVMDLGRSRRSTGGTE